MPVEIGYKTCEINQVFTCCWHGKFIHPSGETTDYMMIFSGEANYTKPINWGNDNWNSPIVGSIVRILCGTPIWNCPSPGIWNLLHFPPPTQRHKWPIWLLIWTSCMRVPRWFLPGCQRRTLGTGVCKSGRIIERLCPWNGLHQTHWVKLA